MWNDRRTTPVALAVLGLALVAGACEQTDVPDTGNAGTEEVAPVALDTLTWFQEGRTVSFAGQSYIVVGEPVYDPAVERVGEFEGTPLYAERGAATHSELFIPLANDYWQRLERSVPDAP